MTGKAIDGSDSYIGVWLSSIPPSAASKRETGVGEPVAGSRQCTVCLAHAVTYVHTLRHVPLVLDPRLSS